MPNKGWCLSNFGRTFLQFNSGNGAMSLKLGPNAHLMLYFFMLYEFHVVGVLYKRVVWVFYFLCCIFVLYEIVLDCVVLVLYACCKPKKNLVVLYCRVVFFRVWNVHVIFFTCVIIVLKFSTCGISCYICQYVESRVVFLRVWNFLTSCYIFLSVEFPCCIITRVELSFYIFSSYGISILYFS